jgi:hypothetical protein
LLYLEEMVQGVMEANARVGNYAVARRCDLVYITISFHFHHPSIIVFGYPRTGAVTLEKILYLETQKKT